MSDVAGEQMGVGPQHGGGDGQVGAVDEAMAG
jgi:hypothetical protein